MHHANEKSCQKQGTSVEIVALLKNLSWFQKEKKKGKRKNTQPIYSLLVLDFKINKLIYNNCCCQAILF